MNIILWSILAALTLAAVVFTGLRELHMLQLNGYKTPEHSWWMKKNFRRYIPSLILLALQFVMIPLGAGAPLVIAFTCFNACFIAANKPGKKFKKPLVYTARVKRMMVTFFILVAAFFAAAFLLGGKLSCILVNTALYLTPILVPLANLINKPVEKSVQRWYINDA